MTHASQFIPPGLLPKFSDDPVAYNRAYQKLRMQHDPEFKKQVRETQKKRREQKRRENANLDKPA